MHNDFDRLFSLGIDIPTCKTLLEQIKEIMVESDWHNVDKESVQLLGPTQVQKQLYSVVDDYERNLKIMLKKIMD